MANEVVGVPKVGRSVFNLSYIKRFSSSMGKLYPSMVDEVVPGDIFEIRKQFVCRFLPMSSPVLHEINIHEWTFFVPYRLLMKPSGDAGGGATFSDSANWEDFLHGGDTGNTDYALPTWDPSVVTVGSLWDAFGFPIGVTPDADNRPLDFPRRAYNFIYREWFQDSEVEKSSLVAINADTDYMFAKRWEKDYFTTSRPSAQKGTSPSIPVSGTLDIDGQDDTITLKNTSDATAFNVRTDTAGDVILGGTPSATANARWVDPQLEVDLSTAITVDIEDFRLLIQTQRWMERNMRAGTRYPELIKAHFNVDMGDHRADRPEMIGATRVPLIVSEVLQTGVDSGDDGVGTMAGHGISVSNDFIGKYRVREYGLIMSILCVMPRTSYSQGINRQWSRETLYEFYWPSFANLSEQPVYQKEIFLSGVKSENETTFGYQGRYNEMRAKPDITTGKLAYNQTLNYWTFGREFAAAPSLNATFLSSRAAVNAGGIRTDPFMDASEDQFVMQVGNIVRAVRPLPLIALPGYLDRN